MKIQRLIPLFLILLLAACAVPATGMPPVTSLPASPSAALAPIPTPTEPAATLPTAPPAETQLPPTDLPPATGAPLTVQVYLVALDDQGVSGKQIGCGDSAVAVAVQVPHTQAVLKAALEKLLAVKEPYYGESGLYNALYQSDLHLDSVTITEGKAVVKLSGTLRLGGECDNPRVAAQLEQTVLQFSTVTRADIYLNGKPLEEVLSLRG